MANTGGAPTSYPVVVDAMTACRESRDSVSFTSTKGLLNGPGQNNCFLNSAVQVLWHLDIFRRSFRDLSGHACMADSCIFCALKELFSQLQFSHETALPPDALRKALAESFFDQQRFQLGFMDDAAECFENMLLRIHSHIAHGEAEDMCNARHCIPHQKFAMTLVEQSICGACKATSEPLSFTQMVHYVSASALTTQVRQSLATSNIGIQDNFGMLLKKAGNMGDIRDCPSSCGAKIQITRTLMNRPEIVSIGIVWDSERPTLEHIMDVFATVGTSLRLADVFNNVVDTRWADLTRHNLVGVVTYYGKHYSTFFFHTKLRLWIYFDDATVREVGPRWEQVVEKCRKGRYQPLLLLYATPTGTPVCTENAPKHVVAYNSNALRRSITPSPEKPSVGNNTRRAITPNPDKAQREYQNLSVIQDSINEDYITRRTVENVLQLQRSLSNSSDDHMIVKKRRDSGNWSGDRNSASSSSSTTMENPYLYLIGKMPNSSLPGSPTRSNCDAGYDSYSLSSNDSSTMMHLMKMGHLAKIPEDYANSDLLCEEVDQLLSKSRQLEDEHDLVLALALCNAAATKARAAMNVPYNNQQTLTQARMKHNTCIMRARSLHRRMTQNQNNTVKENPIEIRHTREGSSGSGGRHSRQNSKDKTMKQKDYSPAKSIEIYATLPKKKDGSKNKMSSVNIEDEEYMIYDKPAQRESRSIFSRNKNKTNKEKRSRSEDRNKLTNFSIAPEIPDNPKKEDKKGKKQHKIRRKLLMGGLIRRKNRSMPDLTEGNCEENKKAKDDSRCTVDDSSIGVKANETMTGYLSEGHLDYTNPNLERSRLMRKSFHTKALTAARVPPPPPLRTTSQLSKSKLQEEQITYANNYHEENIYDSKNSLSQDHTTTLVTTADVHQEQSPYKRHSVDEVDCAPLPLDLPPYPSPATSTIHSRQASEEFPPPPPPLDLHEPNSDLLAQVQTKRQEILSNRQPLHGSQEILTENEAWLRENQLRHAVSLHKGIQNEAWTRESSADDGFAHKRLDSSLTRQPLNDSKLQVSNKSDSENWLKELQAKQAALRNKKLAGNDEINSQKMVHKQTSEAKITSVKDLASRFENYPTEANSIKKKEDVIRTEQNGYDECHRTNNIDHLRLKRLDSIEPRNYQLDGSRLTKQDATETDRTRNHQYYQTVDNQNRQKNELQHYQNFKPDVTMLRVQGSQNHIGYNPNSQNIDSSVQGYEAQKMDQYPISNSQYLQYTKTENPIIRKLEASYYQQNKSDIAEVPKCQNNDAPYLQRRVDNTVESPHSQNEKYDERSLPHSYTDLHSNISQNQQRDDYGHNNVELNYIPNYREYQYALKSNVHNGISHPTNSTPIMKQEECINSTKIDHNNSQNYNERSDPQYIQTPPQHVSRNRTPSESEPQYSPNIYRRDQSTPTNGEIQSPEPQYIHRLNNKTPEDLVTAKKLLDAKSPQFYQNHKTDSSNLKPTQIAEEIKEVEMINAALHKTLHPNQEDDGKSCKLGKKKSVSFCDQVILVATADEQEDDSYIPNPILERVLRSAIHKPEAAAIRQEIISLRENEIKKQELECQRKSPEQNLSDATQNYVEQIHSNEFRRAQEYGVINSCENRQLVRQPLAEQRYPNNTDDILQQNKILHEVQKDDSMYQKRQAIRANSVDNIDQESRPNNIMQENQLRRTNSHQNYNSIDVVDGILPAHETQLIRTSQNNYKPEQMFVANNDVDVVDGLIPSPSQENPLRRQISNGSQQNYNPDHIYNQENQRRPTPVNLQQAAMIQEGHLRRQNNNYYQDNRILENFPRKENQYVAHHPQLRRQTPTNFSQEQIYLNSPVNNSVDMVDGVAPDNYYPNNIGHETPLRRQTSINQDQNYEINDRRQTPISTEQAYPSRYQYPNDNAEHYIQQENRQLYVRQNSMDNLLSRPAGMQTSLSREERDYIMQSDPRYQMRQQIYQQQDQYSVSPRNYNVLQQQVRQSPPIYHHPPSPSPTSRSVQPVQPMQQHNSPYQRVPQPHDPYQRLPNNTRLLNTHPNIETNSHYDPYQKVPLSPHHMDPYQKVPISPQLTDPASSSSPYQKLPDVNFSDSYQRVPMNGFPLTDQKPPKQQLNLKKSVSFEPGTKGGNESPTPKAIVTPIIVNNNPTISSNNNLTKSKCNLCRKKSVSSTNLYCTDCEFYMSRFKPK